MSWLQNFFRRRSYEALPENPGDCRASSNMDEMQTKEIEQVPRAHAQILGVPAGIRTAAVLVLSHVTTALLAVLATSYAILGSNKTGLNSDLKHTTAYCPSSPRSVSQTNAQRDGANDSSSNPAPILDQFDMSPRAVTFNGALRDNSSIWRQPPSPEVDAAWDYISTEGYEVITITASDVLKSGKNPATTIRAPPSWARGKDAYVAQIEVFHQIHCLNELRKEMYYDYYYQTPPDELHRSHKSHCLHMLLQSLMCTADVGVVTHNWVHNEHVPEPKTRLMPDFNVVKKCADFDGLLAWARGAAVQDLKHRFLDLVYVPGDVVVPGDGYA
ncbi:hypothetical protein E4U53_005132 [Claviceps sorghi]|nr:hypothetical protein E4U53_005132 [Claviceps sorghi]